MYGDIRQKKGCVSSFSTRAQIQRLEEFWLTIKSDEDPSLLLGVFDNAIHIAPPPC